jgi:hypothetical protein
VRVRRARSGRAEPPRLRSSGLAPRFAPGLDSRRCESSGPGTSRRESPALDPLRLESRAKKFPATRNEGFTESNLLGEKAA